MITLVQISIVVILCIMFLALVFGVSVSVTQTRVTWKLPQGKEWLHFWPTARKTDSGQWDVKVPLTQLFALLILLLLVWLVFG